MKITTLRALVCFLFASTFLRVLDGAPAELDPTFGGAGKVITPIGPGDDSDYARGMALQDDGKIVVVGNSQRRAAPYLGHFVMARYTADGSLDMTFNGTGKVTTIVSDAGDSASAVALQRDGKIVVAGVARATPNTGVDEMALVRYNNDGSLDLSFNGTGKVTMRVGIGSEHASSVALQGDGKIVVVGHAQITAAFESSAFAVVRFNTDGSLDESFNGTGKVTTDFTSSWDMASSVAVQRDGKIVVSGIANTGSPYNDFAVVRYNADGSMDTSFSGDGKVITNIGGQNSNTHGLALQSDGKILVSGGTEFNGGDFALVRYNANGTLDTGFSGDGKVTTPIGSSYDVAEVIALQSDGKIVAAGSSYNGSVTHTSLVRYLANGSLDLSFNGTGKVITAVSAGDLARCGTVQSDGKILLAGDATTAGNTDFAVVRYKGDITPFGAWKLQRLGDSSAPDNGDPDGNGVLTLAEYGLGLLPNATDAGLTPSLFDYPDGRRLRLFLRRDPAHNDISIEVLAASLLSGPWLAIATSTRGVPFAGPGYFAGDSATAGVKTMEVRDTANVSDGARRFLRVRVSVGGAPAPGG